MRLIRQRCPLSVRGLETRVRNGKDQPASWLQNPSDALKSGLKIRNIDECHTTNTTGKLMVVQPLSRLRVSLNIPNSQWLLLFIALGERQEVWGEIKTGDLRSASGQLARYPTLSAGQITNDFSLD